MTRNAKVEAAVARALDEVQSLLPPGTSLPTGADDPLLEADGGPLDSLGVVNLMVAVEGAVNEDLGTDISLAEFLAEPPDTSPFRSREALRTGIIELMEAGQ